MLCVSPVNCSRIRQRFIGRIAGVATGSNNRVRLSSTIVAVPASTSPCSFDRPRETENDRTLLVASVQAGSVSEASSVVYSTHASGCAPWPTIAPAPTVCATLSLVPVVAI